MRRNILTTRSTGRMSKRARRPVEKHVLSVGGGTGFFLQQDLVLLVAACPGTFQSLRGEFVFFSDSIIITEETILWAIVHKRDGVPIGFLNQESAGVTKMYSTEPDVLAFGMAVVAPNPSTIPEVQVQLQHSSFTSTAQRKMEPDDEIHLLMRGSSPAGGEFRGAIQFFYKC